MKKNLSAMRYILGPVAPMFLTELFLKEHMKANGTVARRSRWLGLALALAAALLLVGIGWWVKHAPAWGAASQAERGRARGADLSAGTDRAAWRKGTRMHHLGACDHSAALS